MLYGAIGGQVLCDLQWSQADEGDGIEELRQLGTDGAKIRIGLETVDEVIIATMEFDLVGSFMREGADVLVGFLAGFAVGAQSHDDVFGGHEREFFGDTTLDDGWVEDQAGADVVEDNQECVGGEEDFREVESTDGAIIKGPLEPLRGVGVAGVSVLVAEMASQGANTFGAHRVSLVGHCG